MTNDSPDLAENPAKRKHHEMMQDYEQSLANMAECMKGRDEDPKEALLFGMAKILKINTEKLLLLDEIKILPLKQKVDAIQDDVKQLKEQVIKLELAKVANSVIIHNLPRHLDAKDKEFENFNQTEYMANELLSAAKVKGSLKIIEATRFLPSKTTESNEAETAKDRPTSVKVTFGDKRQVVTFFSKLNNLKNTPFCKVSVEREIPASLRDRQKELKTAAESYRKIDKCKYKILPKGADLVLWVKKPNEKKYSIVDVD